MIDRLSIENYIDSKGSSFDRPRNFNLFEIPVIYRLLSDFNRLHNSEHNVEFRTRSGYEDS